MLTETTLKHLKPKDAVYKVADRDGMYVTVSVVGTISFRFDYRLNAVSYTHLDVYKRQL